jgi:GT2 family glycosyltransferase
MKNIDRAVIIVATHRRKYLNRLLETLEGLPYQKIINIEGLKVAKNIEKVWTFAKSTGKRYVVSLDDDIEILQPDIIERSIEVLESTGWAACIPYETYNPNYKLGKHRLEVKEREWLPGYFLVIDTHKIGNYIFDASLNENQDHVDLDMSLYAHSLGYRLGMVDRIIVHHSDNHFPENYNRALGAYHTAHANLRKKWSMPSPLVTGKSVYEATYIKEKNVYSSLE